MARFAQDMHRSENAPGWSGSIAPGNRQRGVLALNMRSGVRAIIIGLWLVDGCAFAQTTRTNPSAASTAATIPSSSSTSANTPCNSFNPTSPCYSAKIPRNPCYSAAAPGQPCSTTTTPNPQPSPTPSPLASKAFPAKGHAFTQDQAKAQIEAQGYTNVSGLRRDPKGIWQGKAEKNGLVGNVTLGRDGNVTAY
jgi:hypothetical protein